MKQPISQSVYVKRAFIVLLFGAVLMNWAALTTTVSAQQAQDKNPNSHQAGFAYQGQLKEGSLPANGAYDFHFTLYTAQTGGNRLGSIVKEDVVLTNGLFKVELKFDGVAFDNRESWLEVAVRPGYDTESYTALSPRQRLTPTPYAIFAQQEQWSLIGVPVGFTGGDEKGAIVTDKIEEQAVTGVKDVNEQKATPALAALGTFNFLAKFDGSGNPAANSLIFDNGSKVGLGTTSPLGRFEVSSGSGISPAGVQFIVTRRVGLPDLRVTDFVIKDSRVGIGVSEPNPATMLHVNGRIGVGASSPGALTFFPPDGWAWFHIDNGPAGGRPLGRLRFSHGGSPGAFEIMSLTQEGNVGIGTANPSAKLEVAGTVRGLDLISEGNTRTKVLTIVGGSDLAEPFEVSGAETIRPGMVVAIDPKQPGQLRLARKAYDRAVAGIVSGANGINPGLTMKQEGTVADGSLPVSLTGRVYCWAVASNGPIEPGDLLTTSNTPGQAMKVTNHQKAQGAIIGKAMSSLERGSGLVLVLVNLQ